MFRAIVNKILPLLIEGVIKAFEEKYHLIPKE